MWANLGGDRLWTWEFSAVMFAPLKKQFIALGVIIVVALLFPAVVGRTMIRKNAFDPKPLELLKTDQPQFVVIGDSMCRSRVEESELEKLTGRQVVDLAQNGSASARW